VRALGRLDPFGQHMASHLCNVDTVTHIPLAAESSLWPQDSLMLASTTALEWAAADDEGMLSEDESLLEGDSSDESSDEDGNSDDEREEGAPDEDGGKNSTQDEGWPAKKRARTDPHGKNVAAAVGVSDESDDDEHMGSEESEDEEEEFMILATCLHNCREQHMMDARLEKAQQEARLYARLATASESDGDDAEPPQLVPLGEVRILLRYHVVVPAHLLCGLICWACAFTHVQSLHSDRSCAPGAFS
jgi:hypothetical protein